jgi:hypothetical protein
MGYRVTVHLRSGSPEKSMLHVEIFSAPVGSVTSRRSSAWSHSFDKTFQGFIRSGIIRKCIQPSLPLLRRLARNDDHHRMHEIPKRIGAATTADGD